MKFVNKLMFMFGSVLCAAAAFITVHANDFISSIKYYQPELPEGLEEFKTFYHNK